MDVLAPELGLELASPYEKVEATAEDVIVLLTTLWTRAEDIPAPPRVRLVFHTTVLMAALGGFRPGTLMKLKCKDFELSLICDPDDPVHYKLVVTPTVNRNKIKKSQKISRYKIQPS